VEAVCLVGMATVAEGERAVVAALAKVAAEAEAMVAMVEARQRSTRTLGHRNFEGIHCLLCLEEGDQYRSRVGRHFQYRLGLGREYTARLDYGSTWCTIRLL
jgi:hypothetical protein